MLLMITTAMILFRLITVAVFVKVLTRSEVVGNKVVLSVTVEMVEGGKETSFGATD